MMTPKQPQSERHRDWYPYYAGFSTLFVASTLSRHLDSAAKLLDPWNGAGTTTAVAAARGLRVTGLDINPAATLVARARLTPVGIRSSLAPLADEIVVAAERTRPFITPDDPLHRWFRMPAAASIRQVQCAIHDVLVDGDVDADRRQNPAQFSTELPLLAAFFYAALFAATRDLLQRFRSTNPTWLRYPESYRHKIAPGPCGIASAFASRVVFLAERLTLVDEPSSAYGSVQTASALDLDEDATYDACLTSPPYATRLDYVRSSLAELAVLGLNQQQMDELRRSTTGTPRVKGIAPPASELRSTIGNQLVRDVLSHSSHGSSNYYGPWLRNYLHSLQASLERIHRAVSPQGRIAIVVQDSFYKALHIDLHEIVTETLVDLGRTGQTREDHSARHLFSRINPAAQRHLRNRANCESLLVFS